MDNQPLPLLATDDPQLLEDLLRLAAAASTEVDVARGADHALRLWAHTPLAVVGTDLSSALRNADPPPHRRLVIVCRAPADTTPRKPGIFHLPRDEAELTSLLAEAAMPRRGPAPIVSVIGGRGGAGASLLTVALALAGARAGRNTALLDTDPLGCGADFYLGCEESDHPTGWDDLLNRQGRMRWRDLRPRLPGTTGISVLTWARGSGAGQPAPLPAGTVRAALTSARTGNELVVADLPRSFDPATRVLLNRSDLVLVVVPADVHSVVAATRLVERLRTESPVIRVVVRGAVGELSADVVAQALKLPLGADLPPEPGLARILSRGEPPGQRTRSPLARFADQLMTALPCPKEAL